MNNELWVRIIELTDRLEAIMQEVYAREEVLVARILSEQKAA